MFPKILELGPITIHTYGLLLALAFIAGIWVTGSNAKKEGIHQDAIWNLGLIVIFAALVGSKLLLLISDYSYYLQNPREIFSLSTLRSMGVYYGGLLLALVAAAWYLIKNHLPAWTIADCAAPGIALGQAIGRIGCLSAGCCWGRPTDAPWGICFTNPYSYENVGVPLHVKLHPTQIYESVAVLGLFAYLMWRRTKTPVKGLLILEYLGIYALIRFAIEFYRNDDRGFVLYGLLSTSQFISILTLLGSIGVYVLLLRRSRNAVKN